MAHTFTSLRHSLEKLQEAEYFLAAVAATNTLEFQFNLNAFLAACRSTSFVLQKSMAGVAGFSRWYTARQAEMKADRSMGFFLELRNISQHEGPVSYIGGSTMQPGRWSYRFAGNRESVPPELLSVDVVQACADHLIKIARLLLSFSEAFPFASCPVTALCPNGMAALGFTLDDVAGALGLPVGYLDVGDHIPMSEKLRCLAREFEPMDVAELNRIASGNLQRNGKAIRIPTLAGSDLIDIMASIIESNDEAFAHPQHVFVAAVAKRISDIESD
jgi:hypothetical protein